jgi:hypothetical protein
MDFEDFPLMPFGPLAVISRFPGWKFEIVLRESAIGKLTVVAGRRRGQRIALVTDRWDKQAAESLHQLLMECS